MPKKSYPLPFPAHSGMSENQNPLKPSEIRQICLDNGLIIKDPQWQLLEEWADLLLNYNQQINLVSRKETDL